MAYLGILNLILSLFLAGFNLSPALHSNPDILHLDPTASVFELAADKGAVLDGSGRFFLFAKNADEIQPIASITKLMTALVFLEHNPGWEVIYEITAADRVEGGRLNLFPGDQVTLKDLFYTALVASDNGAALALTRASNLGEERFIIAMNEKAAALGLKATHFVDPIGLSADNVSTAREVAFLAQAALNKPEIQEAVALPEYEFLTRGGREKKIESTDYLLFDNSPGSLKALGGKTGYTESAGYCFVGRLRDQAGRELISVVLNSSGLNERFRESRALAEWVFDNYHRSADAGSGQNR